MEAFCSHCQYLNKPQTGGHYSNDCPHEKPQYTSRQLKMMEDKQRRLIIYLYSCALTKKAIYVGKTSLKLSVRDSVHRSCGKNFRMKKKWATSEKICIFDQGYFEPSQYQLQVLFERIYESYDEYKFSSFHLEQYYISKYETMKSRWGKNCPTEEMKTRLGDRLKLRMITVPTTEQEWLDTKKALASK